ncbi:Cobalt-zinc-cadmium resistance protein CzcA, Cation efflux system protein CusA [Thermogutta terrifontis]|uniref:Cobalt-zinc-cadmium resistance protein CzcA, Cation efflux system protein CusA n=1 Tax=Thermogutta terrifontis TaxID=1331910 RepID=A0A286RK75_9BACT|nr:efflux RND transporter permease subunit [Thermogutta terrifontis]ASV76375.1 Cobalt-zinc-cadmium resistance protein CzcA, Cation efflux system protein CusA [Thermogutta terrifontis]
MNDNNIPFTSKFIDTIIRFTLDNKLVVFLIITAIVVWGLAVMPFDINLPWLPRSPIPVDAFPDIGENQQIVIAEWPGRTPQDVEDQVTYPLTVSLLGVPGVKTIRSSSYFGFSMVYVIFRDDVDFYWARSRILERLPVAQKSLPPGVNATLGPDATALGQVFWYTLEGRDPKTGQPVPGWDPEELRSIQDWQVRYALQSVEGVAEVASVGGFVREYQVDVDPEQLAHYGVTLEQVLDTVRRSNLDVGARTIEINGVDYMIRSRGFIRSVEDLENAVIKTYREVPILVKNVARVTLGPAMRRGVLNKGGAEAVGGVVVVRYGENPMEVIKRVKQKIAEIAPGLPRKKLSDGRISQVTIVPFYDRTQLIQETLGTLSDALRQQVIVTIIVVLIMVNHFRSSFLISSLLPMAVLMSFIGMKLFHVDSNLMSLAGIAIAIGTMVDMGIILTENMLKHLDEAPPDEPRKEVIFRAASEVGRPVLTAISTTVLGFLPVFVMTGPEGKMFRPLAYTKTFALIASVIIALTLLPPLAHILFSVRKPTRWLRLAAAGIVLVGSVIAGANLGWWLVVVGMAWAGGFLVAEFAPPWEFRYRQFLTLLAAAVAISILAADWLPLGPGKGLTRNIILAGGVITGLLAVFLVFQKCYSVFLRFFLRHKLIFYLFPVSSLLLGACIWLGFERVFAFVPNILGRMGIARERVLEDPIWVWARHEFPGLGREFMPPLDEGSFLLMPTAMPHAALAQAQDYLEKQVKLVSSIPEVDVVVGKIGRVDSALDPAPISMIETVITYKPEYIVDTNGRRLTFKAIEKNGRLEFIRDSQGNLIPDPRGWPYRQWRPEIRSADDLWREIERTARLPGLTAAPKLQPIAARIVMLQTGIRAAMAARIRGNNLDDIYKVALQVENILKEAPGVDPKTVFADRMIASPYLEIVPRREDLARYGVKMEEFQYLIETAVGGEPLTTTVEGRERYPVRVRYLRERRDSIEELKRILVTTATGAQVPLELLADIHYVQGPMEIRSEDTKLVGYVIFDKQPGYAEVDVVEACQRLLRQKLESGELVLPPGTEMPTFIGSYQNQVRSARTLAVVIPLTFFIIFLILYFQFRNVLTTFIVFSGVLVAASGGFLLLYLYAQPWFADFSVFGVNLRDLFQMRTLNLSVAVWVGFIALWGIATDDGVVIASYLDQSFAVRKPRTVEEIREATVAAGLRRIRPCLMTTATTVLALLPVLTSVGRGSDVMVPIAIPSFGGMLIELMTLFVVPVSYCLMKEISLKMAHMIRFEKESAEQENVNGENNSTVGNQQEVGP